MTEDCNVCLVRLKGDTLSSGCPTNKPHVFHLACARKWRDVTDVCPTCRDPNWYSNGIENKTIITKMSEKTLATIGKVKDAAPSVTWKDALAFVGAYTILSGAYKVLSENISEENIYRYLTATSFDDLTTNEWLVGSAALIVLGIGMSALGSRIKDLHRNSRATS